MNFKQQIRYFLYVTNHWGLSLGLFTLFTEWKGEKKYGITTTSVKDLGKLQIKGSNLPHATEYMPVNYHLLETLLSYLPASAYSGIFLDIGCGKGRALCVAAAKGFNNVQGIDFAKELLHDAEANLAVIKKTHPQLLSELLWMDVADFTIPASATCLFLFNPFGEPLIHLLAEKIQQWQQTYQKPLYLLYASPRYVSLFYNIGFEKVNQYRKGKYIEGFLLKLEKNVQNPRPDS